MTGVNHVLNSIDRALADWTVSTDAMRWTPTATRPVPAAASLTFTLAPAAEAVAAYFGGAQRIADAVGLDLADWQARAADAVLQPLGEPTEPAEPPADPREAALQARRTRNTGPAHDATRERRPRHHPGTPTPGRTRHA